MSHALGLDGAWTVPQEAQPWPGPNPDLPETVGPQGRRAFMSRLGLSAESFEGQRQSGVSCGPGVTRSMASCCWVRFCELRVMQGSRTLTGYIRTYLIGV